MRKSGLAAAAGLGSLVLLLAACGGSGSNSAAGSPSSAASSVASAPVTTASSATAVATATKTHHGTTTKPKPNAHKSVAPQPSSGDQSIPPVGTTVMIVQKSTNGYVLARADHQVVYTYSKDTKGGKPTCTGACAEAWPPVKGIPQAGPADVFPGQFGLVTGAGGVKQITYDGYPLYVLKGAKPFSTAGAGSSWHVVPLSASDIRT